MISETQKKLLDNFNEGLRLYKQRQWDQALEYFQGALSVKPDDGPSALYIERCMKFKETPPPDDWDGVFTMKTK